MNAYDFITRIYQNPGYDSDTESSVPGSGWEVDDATPVENTVENRVVPSAPLIAEGEGENSIPEPPQAHVDVPKESADAEIELKSQSVSKSDHPGRLPRPGYDKPRHVLTLSVHMKLINSPQPEVGPGSVEMVSESLPPTSEAVPNTFEPSVKTVPHPKENKPVREIQDESCTASRYSMENVVGTTSAPRLDEVKAVTTLKEDWRRISFLKSRISQHLLRKQKITLLKTSGEEN